MPQPEPKTPKEIAAFKALLENPSSDAFAGVDPIVLEAFKKDYLEMTTAVPWFKAMLPQFGPLWLLILTSLIGMRWGLIYWTLGLLWLVVVGTLRYRARQDRWSALMTRGRAGGMIA